VPTSYLVVDRASSLDTLAALLEAESQLAWLSGSTNPYPTLRDLLNGAPFGERPPPRRPRPIDYLPSATTPAEEITWTLNIQPLLYPLSGLAGHTGPKPIYGNFDVRTYESVLFGGDHRATNPTVVKGDHKASLLWQVLAGPVPSLGIVQMPDSSPPLSSGEL